MAGTAHRSDAAAPGMADRGVMTYKAAAKRFLGELPLTAEVYWQIRQSGKPLNRSFSLRHAEKGLLEWRAAVEESLKQPAWRKNGSTRQKVLLFAELHYWIEHAALLGMALA